MLQFFATFLSTTLYSLFHMRIKHHQRSHHRFLYSSLFLLLSINTDGIERKRNNYCDLDLDLDCDLGLDDGGGGDGDDDGTLLHHRHHYLYLRRGARRSRRRAPTGTFLITFLLSVR